MDAANPMPIAAMRGTVTMLVVTPPESKASWRLRAER